MTAPNATLRAPFDLEATLRALLQPWREALLDRGYASAGSFLLNIGDIRGVLVIYAATEDAFGEEECALLEDLAWGRKPALFEYWMHEASLAPHALQPLMRWRMDDAREGVRGGRLVPLESVIRNIARSTPGRLLDAGLEDHGGRPVYRVRWQAANGQRIDFIVDARSGAIIGRN